jgi:iron complex outermembrane recepter protein
MTEKEFGASKLALNIRSILFTTAGMAALHTPLTFAEEAEEGAEEKGEKIVVVGSRIRRDDYASAQPIEIISAEDAISQGVDTVGELLRRTTIAAGSSQVTAATSTAFVQNGGTGTQTLSLRGLGANRTLVLLNGRRAGPAGTRGGVSSFDFNVLPLSAVERIEILKDGSSSLYGSEAIAGVINIITKWDDGGNVSFFTNQPSESGGESSRMNGTWGKTFESSAFRVTVDYDKQSELARGDRDYFACSQRYIFDRDSGERADPVDPFTGDYHCNDLLWGHVWLYDYQGAGGNVPGSLAQYDYNNNLGGQIDPYAVDPSNPDYLVTPPGWFPVGYDPTSDGVANADHPFQDLQSFVPESTRATIFAQGKMDVGETMEAYAEALFNRRETISNGYRQFWTYIYNENFNPFAGGFIGSGNSLATGWTGAQWLSPTAITDHSGSEITVDYRRFVAGLNGDLGDWFWDVSLQSSKSDGEYKTAIIFNDAIEDNWFGSGSCTGTTTSVNGTPCVDVPWLDPQLLAGNISSEVRDFLFSYDTGNTEYTQDSIEGFITGDIMDLDAGPVGVAVGFHYREDEIIDTPGIQTRNGNAWGASSAGITTGSDTTQAFFAEADIPIITDAALAESIDLTLSARHTDVDSYGGELTYKMGLNWGMYGGVSLRASKGTSFRSPALFELYLADQTSFASQRNDPCRNWQSNLDSGAITQRIADNCAAEGVPGDHAPAISATVRASGAIGKVEAETSTAKSIGLVWQPEFIDLQMSLDYFDFVIENEITQLGIGNILAGCYSSEFFGNEPLCDLFERDPVDLRVNNVIDDFINIATQRNRGWDFSLNYRTELEIGRLNINTKHTYQTEDSTELFPGTNRDTNGEFGDPKHVGTLAVSLSDDDWSVDWFVRYVDSVSNVARDGGNTINYRGTEVRAVKSAPHFMYHTLSSTYTFGNSGVTGTFGISNVFDKRPPQVTTIGTSVSSAGDSAFYTQYDWYGRSFFLNLSYDFE